MSPTLKQRGEKLRNEIELEFRKLRDTKQIKHETFISGLVTKYIPVGTTFDDAEEISRAAGFKVNPRPQANSTGKRSGRDSITAITDPLEKGLYYNYTVITSLCPLSRGLFLTKRHLSIYFL